MERTSGSIQEAQQKFAEMRALDVPNAKVLFNSAPDILLVYSTLAKREGLEAEHVLATSEGEDRRVPANSRGSTQEGGGVHRVLEEAQKIEPAYLQ